MKYIRTKSNHIYKTLGDFMQVDLPQSKIRVENVNKGWHVVIYKSEIIKHADTIEELCDEIVVENPEKDIHKSCCDLQDMFDWVDDQEIPIGIKSFDEKRDLISGEHDWNVYGAIWTEWGLKYVAKMNEKGELGLL